MAKWIRLLSRPSGASSQWHVLAGDREFAVADGLCGERFAGPVEVARDEERTEREGRCPSCDAALAAKEKERVTGARG